MRQLGKSMTSLGLIALLAAPALAQRPGGARGGMVGGQVLTNEGVHQELKLDEQQVARVNEVAREMAEARRKQVEALQSASPDERREKGMAILAADNEKTRTALREILKPEQFRRYEQITLQQQGLRAFGSPEVQGRLKLTEDQRETLRAMNEESQTQMREAMQSADGTFEERREKMEAAQKARMEKVSAMLDADQRASWKELTGDPFEIRYEGGAGGNRPGARRPGANP